MSAAGPPQGAKAPLGGSDGTQVPSVGVTLVVDGIDVVVEGEGADTVVMIHGWPDTHRLWDAQVAHLRARHRCVRFTLPGFDLDQPRRAMSLAQMSALFLAIVDAVSPDRKVTLMLHDWGCIYGYEFALRHADRVARVVAVDIGDYNAPALVRALSARAKRLVFGYQIWLALAWMLGGRLGDWMTRRMARWARWKGDLSRVGAQMNYPYHARWFGSLGGFKGAARIEPAWPLLYFHGTRKPFMFQTQGWLDRVAALPHSETHALATGHWVMVQQPEAFNRIVADWLARTPA